MINYGLNLDLETHILGCTAKNTPQGIADAVRKMVLSVPVGVLIGNVRAEVRYRHETMAEECVLYLEYMVPVEDDTLEGRVTYITDSTAV